MKLKKAIKIRAKKFIKGVSEIQKEAGTKKIKVKKGR